jgi:ABC-2 type transport system permease protein
MNLHRTIATSARVLRQLRHDPRTIALILVLPVLLLVLLKYVFDDAQPLFQSVAPMILGILPFTIMFIVTSIATLRERTSGTLERLMTMPIAKLDLVLGYALAFAALAVLQAIIAGGVMVGLLGVSIQGHTWVLLLVAVINGILGMSLGLFVSAFARTEFQAVQFMPAFVMPQLFVCGIFIARDQMAIPLQWFSNVMPLTYAVDAMKIVATSASWTTELSRDCIVLTGFIIAALSLGALTLRRSR